MKPVILRMDSKGSISTESFDNVEDKFAARIARLRARRRGPLYPEIDDMTMDNESIKADINSLVQLGSIAGSLESLTEVMDSLLEENGMSPENIQQFELLANEIAGPLGEDPILLTDAQGVASTESIASQARAAYAGIVAGIKQLTSTVSQYYLRYRGLSGQLHAQLKSLQRDLKKIKYAKTLEIIPTPAMAGICAEDGSFDLSIAATTLRAFQSDVKWVVNVLAPETANMLDGVTQWLDTIDVSDDNTVTATFTKITDVATPQSPSDWRVVPMRGMMTVTRSALLFSNHCFTATRPLHPTPSASDYLVKAVMGSEITFTSLSDNPVVADDAVVSIDSIDTVLKMIDGCLEILDFNEVFSLHQVRLGKGLNGLINAGERLMQRSAAASGLSDASMAILVLAIQSPQSISLKAQSPFRDVLYESIRVTTGVIGLANAVKTAESSAE